MDEYEVLSTKEQNLRKLLDAFPGADIMEAQDILARCDWDLPRATSAAFKLPLKCKKRKNFLCDESLSSQETIVSCDNSNSSLTSDSLANRVELDDSDDSIESIKQIDSLNQNNARKAKRVRQILSSDSDDDISNTGSIKKQALNVSGSSTISAASTPVSSALGTSTLNLPNGLVLLEFEEDKDINSSSSSVASNGNNVSITSRISHSENSPAANSVSGGKSAMLVRIQSATSTQRPPTVTSSRTINETVSKTSRHTVTPAKTKRKKVKLGDDDEDDDYDDDELLFDSDDSDFSVDVMSSAHSAVLKFFQDATPEELACVQGCSKKKVEAMISLRPFKNWSDLVQKLQRDKNLSTDMLSGAKRVVDMRNAINKLMIKCQQISIEMECLVEDLKEKKESSTEYVSKQPKLLNDKLKMTPYQMLGLNWMLLLHNQEVNGILADEMGLGKTVQAIAFLAYLKETCVGTAPHLIVAPSSTLDNWKQEFERWWPDVSLIMYHGSQDSRRELRIQILNDEVDEFDVIITTYNMVASSAEDRGFFKRIGFHYVVFDEAHMLKNMASLRYQHLMKIKASRRLLLTGTPLQNNLVELMSLLIFAMPHMFSAKAEHIKLMFSSVSKVDGNKNAYEKERIEHAKKIMKPFVLRRLKKDVLQDLPAKHDSISICPMTENQAQRYTELVETLSAEFKHQEKVESSKGTGLLMQLRKAANHPLLRRHVFDDGKLIKMSKAMLKEPSHREASADLILEDMSIMSDFELHRLCKNYSVLKPYILSDDLILDSGKFRKLDLLLPQYLKEDHRVLLFSQFTMVLDIVEEYMKIRKHKFLRLDGQVPVSERQQLINQFNRDSSILVFLLSTRAGGLGINLTAADTVIIHDIDFNPYNDKQAEDRCHRVGQVREVSVTRLISEHTIEEGMLQRALEKLKLERDIHEINETEENDVVSVAKLLVDALGLKNSKT